MLQKISYEVLHVITGIQAIEAEYTKILKDAGDAAQHCQSNIYVPVYVDHSVYVTRKKPAGLTLCAESFLQPV